MGGTFSPSSHPHAPTANGITRIQCPHSHFTAGLGGRAPVPRPSGAGPRWLFVLVGFRCKGDRPEGLVCEIEGGGNEEPAAGRGGEDKEEIGGNLVMGRCGAGNNRRLMRR